MACFSCSSCSEFVKENVVFWTSVSLLLLVLKTGPRVSRGFLFLTPHELNFELLMKTQKKGKWKGMRESCLVYCYSGIQSLFEVVLLYTFYTEWNKCDWTAISNGYRHARQLLLKQILCEASALKGTSQFKGKFRSFDALNLPWDRK